MSYKLKHYAYTSLLVLKSLCPFTFLFNLITNQNLYGEEAKNQYFTQIKFAEERCKNALTAANGRPFFGHKSPAARARELFKPFTDSASLLVEIEKNVFRFGVFWR